jgi:hypothetical protein
MVFRREKWKLSIDGNLRLSPLGNSAELGACRRASCGVGCTSALEFCRQVSKRRTESANTPHPAAQKRRQGEHISGFDKTKSSPSEGLRSLRSGGCQESLLQIMCCRGFKREHGSGGLNRAFTPQDTKGQGSNFQKDQQPCRSEHVVGPEKSAELADGGMLHPENSAIAQRQESSRDRGKARATFPRFDSRMAVAQGAYTLFTLVSEG